MSFAGATGAGDPTGAAVSAGGADCAPRLAAASAAASIKQDVIVYWAAEVAAAGAAVAVAGPVNRTAVPVALALPQLNAVMWASP